MHHKIFVKIDLKVPAVIKNMEIFETLPDYPSISYHDFNLDIFRKKEFNELSKEVTSGCFFSWQKIISRFLSHWTLYEGLLLIHDTGTGKSGSAAAVYDGIRRYSNLKVLYLTSNETLIDNFKAEVVRRSKILSEEVSKEEEDEMDKESYNRARAKVLKRENFVFKTYGIFASRLQDEDPSYWEGSLIIMDEVHNLIVTDIENKPDSNYFVILDWLDKIKKKRVLVLTATPMRQEVDEIAPILNLVLPSTKRFEIGKEFKNKYFNVVSKKDKSVDELQWRKDMKDEFQEKIKGYVSVVKQRRDVKVEYIGNILKPIQYYRLYAHTMDEFQSKTYLAALTKDETEKKKKGGVKSSSFYSNAQQASLFVFPNGEYGEKANEKFITNSTFSIVDPNTKKETNILVNKLDPEFMKLSKCKYGDENIDHNIEMIRKYSSTYASIIQHILDNPTEHIYVYCDKVNGSGILVLIVLLTSLFNFSKVTGKTVSSIWKKKKRRLILLNEVQGDTREKDFQTLIDSFNDPNNIDADYIQVIFGTDKTKEGISLKRIRQMHVTSGDWHFGKIFQAIGRGVRLLSHADLSPEERNVKIFLHCAIPLLNSQHDVQVEQEQDDEQQVEDEDDEQEDDDLDFLYGSDDMGQTDFTREQLSRSIDFKRYYRSELYDLNIKKIEYSLLVSAFDCQLNKHVNKRDGYDDYSPECYYTKCRYECNGFEDVDVSKVVIDYSNYDYFYATEKLDYVIKQVSKLFNDHPIWSFDQVCKKLNPEINNREIFEALEIILDTPLPIIYKGYHKLYLSRNENTLFLIDNVGFTSIETEHPEYMMYYALHPSFYFPFDYDALMDLIVEKHDTVMKIVFTVNQWVEKPGDYTNHLIKLMDAIPLTYQEAIIFPLFIEMITKNTTSKLKKFWDVYYSDRFFQNKEGDFIHRLFPVPRKYNTQTGDWEDFTDAVPMNEEDHNTDEFKKKYIEDNKYKIYGYFVKKPNSTSFKIRDVRDKKKPNKTYETIGKECTSYSMNELLHFLFIVGQRYPTEKPDNPSLAKNYDCTAILNSKKIELVTKNKPEWKSFINEFKELKTDVDVMRFFHYFSSLTKKQLCGYLQSKMKEEDLIVLPPLHK
jgi:superfamily II DNA or RNA helicase